MDRTGLDAIDFQAGDPAQKRGIIRSSTARTIRNKANLDDKISLSARFNRVDRAKPGAIVLLEHPDIRTAHGLAVIWPRRKSAAAARSRSRRTDPTVGRIFRNRSGASPINPKQPLTASAIAIRATSNASG